MAKRSLVSKYIYWARNVRSKQLFEALRTYCHGNVLDVGGGAFYETAAKKHILFNRWVTLEESVVSPPRLHRSDHTFVVGDGQNTPFPDRQFDTVLNIQVLEHVLEPIQMVSEIARMLKSGGYGILLIPQTSTLHAVPRHYYNFTRFWIEEVMEKVGLEIVELRPLGGIWSSMASHLIFFFLQSCRFSAFSPPECKRNGSFYLLYPLMIVYALISIPVCMFFSLGDLSEEPNNHLVVVRKLAV
jgi:SAM-dependent methyltransferase